MSTIQTPKVAPAKAVSHGLTKPSMLPMAPPVRPSTKAATVQAVILQRPVRSPIASALSSLSRMAFSASPKRVR